MRESAKNIAIEKGLKRAAENRNSLSRLKGSKLFKKKTTTTMTSSSISDAGFAVGGSGSSLHKVAAGGSVDRNRGKKVYSTAKQRLGKILGLKF